MSYWPSSSSLFPANLEVPWSTDGGSISISLPVSSPELLPARPKKCHLVKRPQNGWNKAKKGLVRLGLPSLNGQKKNGGKTITSAKLLKRQNLGTRKNNCQCCRSKHDLDKTKLIFCPKNVLVKPFFKSQPRLVLHRDKVPGWQGRAQGPS